ncbi:hypothetical protein LY78DRAFT_237421 [Colletotrichum sublineola]|nr:hypothetical protein LY78DRAFT_237421 [Colletotrichum sublineola]
MSNECRPTAASRVFDWQMKRRIYRQTGMNDVLLGPTFSRRYLSTLSTFVFGPFGVTHVHPWCSIFHHIPHRLAATLEAIRDCPHVATPIRPVLDESGPRQSIRQLLTDCDLFCSGTHSQVLWNTGCRRTGFFHKTSFYTVFVRVKKQKRYLKVLPFLPPT